MKKLLSILTISTLTASVPAPLMAMKSSDDEWEIINKDDIPTANRFKRDVSTLTSNANNAYLPIKKINGISGWINGITFDSRNNIYLGTDNGGCYKGILDLKNTLNYIAKIINKEPPNIKILLNNVKNNDVTETIWEWLKNDNLTQYLLKCEIKHSDTFSKNTVKLDTIWTNSTYWRQKQAYEELIKEIK